MLQKLKKKGFSKESKEIRHLLPQALLKIIAFIFRSASVPAGERLAERIHQDFTTLKSCKLYHPLDSLELLRDRATFLPSNHKRTPACPE